jgi:hypothetical protein
MDARSKFHLARARAHLERGDTDRALRHLHKCGFGKSNYATADAAADAWFERPGEKTELSDELKSEVESAYARGDFNALYDAFVAHGAQSGVNGPLPRGIATVVGLIRSLATYDTAAEAARAYEKLVESNKLEEMRSTEASDYETLLGEVKEALGSADHNKLFRLLVQAERGAISDILGTMRAETVPHLIRGAVHKSADAAADAYEKMTDEERERAKKIVAWKVFSDALAAAYKARDVNALLRVLVEQGADARMLTDLPYGVTSVAGLIRSLATYDTADDAARAYTKLEKRGKLDEMRSTKKLDLATLRSAVIEAIKSADHNKLFHLVVQEGTSKIADAMHGSQNIPRLMRGAVHKSADDAADAYEKMTGEERAARKTTRLETKELHRAVQAAYAAYDYNALFHLAVRHGGFDAQDLGVKFETFGAGTKSVVDLIRSRARYDSAEEAAAAYMKLTLPQREARKAAIPLKLHVFGSELVAAHKANDHNALYHLVVRWRMGVDPQNDVKLVKGVFGRNYDPFTRVESIEDLIRSTRRSTKEY